MRHQPKADILRASETRPARSRGSARGLEALTLFSRSNMASGSISGLTLLSYCRPIVRQVYIGGRPYINCKQPKNMERMKMAKTIKWVCVVCEYPGCRWESDLMRMGDGYWNQYRTHKREAHPEKCEKCLKKNYGFCPGKCL